MEKLIEIGFTEGFKASMNNLENLFELIATVANKRRLKKNLNRNISRIQWLKSLKQMFRKRHRANNINTEDFSAAVDFLELQKNVDRDQIGIIGICGFAGMD